MVFQSLKWLSEEILELFFVVRLDIQMAAKAITTASGRQISKTYRTTSAESAAG